MEISGSLPVVFPVHPRTRKHIKQFGFEEHYHFIEIEENQVPSLRHNKSRILSTPPLGYLDFLQLMSNSKIVLTDSGGIQEETCILGIPCVTLRNNTERPVTVEVGTNKVAGTNKAKILEACQGFLQAPPKNNSQPKFWDGKATERIVGILVEKFGAKTEN